MTTTDADPVGSTLHHTDEASEPRFLTLDHMAMECPITRIVGIRPADQRLVSLRKL